MKKIFLIILLLVSFYLIKTKHKDKEEIYIEEKVEEVIEKKEEVIEEIDDTVPSIVPNKDVLYIDKDNQFNPLDNISVVYGFTGGNTSCDKTVIEIGENIITCIAEGNNKLSSSASYKVIMTNTYQKNAIFFGDSIVYGFMSTPVGYSWANYINDNYDLNVVTNAGITDYRVSTYDDANKWLVSEVRSHYDDPYNYDFIILQGGINDIFYNTPIGSISGNRDINSFNINTFCGGLESYLYYVTNKWSNAKIGYIITYNTPKYRERGLSWSYADYKRYYDVTKEILDKWNIKYLDLSTEEFNNLLRVEDRIYLPDYLHLNNEGYRIISPYIYNFMQTLDKYN